MSFADRIKALKAYKRKHGTVNVDRKSKEYPELAHWVESTRRRNSYLTLDQRAQLDELGFIWKQPHMEKYQKAWDGMFTRLKAFHKLNGHCMVKTEDTSLGVWVKNQRANYVKGILKLDRKKKLDELNFVWRVATTKNTGTYTENDDRRWRKRYNELVQYKKTVGHCRVPLMYPENKALADWVNNQRTVQKRNLMRSDRETMLDAIDFDWDPYRARGIDDDEP